MDKERYIVIRNRAYELAKEYGMLDYAEDFAQEAALTISHGRKATIRQLWIDFLRKEFGSSRSTDSEAVKSRTALKQEERKYAAEVDDKDQAFAGNYQTYSSELKYYQNTLDGLERQIFTFVCYGLTMKEIGEAYGVSEGRICQLFSTIRKKLKLRKRRYEEDDNLTPIGNS